MLQPLLPEVRELMASGQDVVSYWYQDRDPFVGNPQRLPRTATAEALGRALMAELEAEWSNAAGREGKMYGVLMVEKADGERGWLKAFSGLLEGSAERSGWVPTIPGRDRVALLEAQTLSQLEALKLELISLKCIPQRKEHEERSQEFAEQLQQMGDRHRENKAQRKAQRDQLLADSPPPLAKGGFEARKEEQSLWTELEEQSRRDGRERRALKRERDQVLKPLKTAIAQADEQRLSIKRQRKALSQKLQAEMHRAYSLQNFSGEAVSLTDLGLGSLPTGTGECCAPKLLHYAASQQLKPLALAEFWWGAATRDRQPGQFYGACEERCQPLMGFLLSGLDRLVRAEPKPMVESSASEDLSLPILYEDAWVIAVDKPAGLLSVPGRSRQNQDSVLSRLRNQLKDEAGHPLGDRLNTVHRLDQDTSGILLLAKDAASQRNLHQQFQQQQISKTYEAILQGQPMLKGGSINLPLAADPENRPRQRVDHEAGKPSKTHFIVLDRRGGRSRVRFEPITGRTHQLRIHAAEGLGMAIVGDRLYGMAAPPPSNPASRDSVGSLLCNRLHLHASQVEFRHPFTDADIILRSPAPF